MRGRRRLTTALVAVVWLVAVVSGCGTSGGGDAEAGPSEGTEEGRDRDGGTGAPGKGPVRGDPDRIRTFADPGAEIEDAADLTAYLLPGLEGAGVDCIRDAIDHDAVLSAPVDDGAPLAAGVVADCVSDDTFGAVFAIYAVGFDPDAHRDHRELEACASDGFAELSSRERTDALERVYEARLDLAAPPTSPDLAADAIDEHTSCDRGGSRTSITTTTTAPRTTTTVPRTTTTVQPKNQRPVPWNLLQPGDCIASLPVGRITNVTVSDCGVPHTSEVVGASFMAPEQAQTGCANLFQNFTGRPVDGSGYVLDILESEPGAMSMRVVCIASPADGSTTTGSLRAG